MIHHLGIGNNFVGTSSELAGCVNDAKDTAAEFKPWLASSKVIVNTKADHAGIFKEGRKFLDRLEPGDLGIISNSSHGTREKIGGKWHEAIVTDGFDLIYDVEFDALLSDRAPGSFLAVFSDSCFSGGLPRGGTFSQLREQIPQRGKRKTIPLARCQSHKLLDRSAQRALENVIYFSGCKDTEYSYDATFDGRPNGAMTYHLLQAFRELKGSSATFGKLFAKLAGKRPKGYLPTEEYPQTPVVVASQRNLRRTLKSFVQA